MSSCNKKKEVINPVAEEVEVSSEQLIPDTFFKKSLEAFAAKDYQKSADQIREAATALSDLSDLTDEQQNTAIEKSVKDLNELAQSVATDKVDGIQELYYFFGKAERTLAVLHMKNAESYYYKLDGKQAGSELVQVIDQVENLLKYQQHDLTKQEENFLGETKSFTAKMQNGDQITNDQVEGLLKSLNKHLIKWDSEVSVTYTSHKQAAIVPAPNK